MSEWDGCIGYVVFDEPTYDEVGLAHTLAIVDGIRGAHDSEHSGPFQFCKSAFCLSANGGAA